MGVIEGRCSDRWGVTGAAGRFGCLFHFFFFLVLFAHLAMELALISIQFVEFFSRTITSIWSSRGGGGSTQQGHAPAPTAPWRMYKYWFLS